MKKTFAGLAGLIVAMAPLALSGQGLHVSSVIPTQSLLQHATAFRQLTPRAPAIVAVAPAPAVSCNMPVAMSATDAPGRDAGGISPPKDRAISILTIRSACVNRMAEHVPDSDVVKKP